MSTDTETIIGDGGAVTITPATAAQKAAATAGAAALAPLLAAAAANNAAILAIALQAAKYLKHPEQLADLRDGIAALTASLPAAQRTAVRQWFLQITEAVARLAIGVATDSQ